MKRLVLSLVAICAVALPTVGLASSYTTTKSGVKTNAIAVVQGPDGKLACRAAGKPCTEAQVNALAAKGKSSGGPDLSLAKDGSLLCGEKPCTTAHLAALNEAAATVNKSNMDAVKIAPSPLPK
jgi:hypothetical protein